ncbi:MAG: hypothetical protein AAGA23_09740 [Pseudomonadota bacterium]
MSRVCNAALLLLPLVTAGCNTEIPPSALPAKPVIEVYDVPGNAIEIAETLKYLTQDLDGRASVLGENQIVVSAPASVHPGVKAMVQEMRDLPAATGKRVRLHYWLVAAQPAEDATVPNGLRPIRDALLDTSRATGGLAFKRLDYVQHVLRSDARSNVSGDRLGGEVHALVRNDQIALNLSLYNDARRVGTRVDVADGETVLLAQVGMESEDGDMLMFLVRAELF